jgi:RimJ/RimL family protein N-acetyltransferase
VKLRLIEIGQDGAPARCPGYLSPAARDALEGTAAFYEIVGFAPPWIGYLGDRDGDIVGSCAFKGAPENGRVEIAYQIFPGFEAKGLATEMTRQLVKLAQQADPSVLLVAHTLPEESASTALLRKLGFALGGPVEHPEDGTVWEWQLPASSSQASAA